MYSSNPINALMQKLKQQWNLVGDLKRTIQILLYKGFKGGLFAWIGSVNGRRVSREPRNDLRSKVPEYQSMIEILKIFARR